MMTTDKRVIIYQHAIDMMIDKVKGGDHKKASAEQMSQAYEKILKAVRDPDDILHKEKEKPQIHIKGDIAVPVGTESDQSGIYLPYDNETEKVVVPTTFRSNHIVKNNGKEQART